MLDFCKDYVRIMLDFCKDYARIMLENLTRYALLNTKGKLTIQIAEMRNVYCNFQYKFINRLLPKCNDRNKQPKRPFSLEN